MTFGAETVANERAASGVQVFRSNRQAPVVPNKLSHELEIFSRPMVQAWGRGQIWINARWCFVPSKTGADTCGAPYPIALPHPSPPIDPAPRAGEVKTGEVKTGEVKTGEQSLLSPQGPGRARGKSRLGREVVCPTALATALFSRKTCVFMRAVQDRRRIDP